jgi:hypothetical protein
MTVDITTASLVLVYFGMAGYIVWLQYRLREVKRHAGMLSMAVKDLIEGKVTVEKVNGKLTVRHSEG